MEATTDGVWETRNTSDEMFGKDRVCELIRTNAHRRTAEIDDVLRAELASFRGEHSQDDDITFVVVKVT